MPALYWTVDVDGAPVHDSPGQLDNARAEAARLTAAGHPCTVAPCLSIRWAAAALAAAGVPLTAPIVDLVDTLEAAATQAHPARSAALALADAERLALTLAA